MKTCNVCNRNVGEPGYFDIEFKNKMSGKETKYLCVFCAGAVLDSLAIINAAEVLRAIDLTTKLSKTNE